MNAKEIALGEIKALAEILSHVDTAQIDQLVREFTQAKRIFPPTLKRHPPHIPVPSIMIGFIDTIVFI